MEPDPPAGGKPLPQRLLDQSVAKLVNVPLPWDLLNQEGIQPLIHRRQQLGLGRFFAQ